MSSYGNPPPDPYQQPGQPYGQPYGQPGPGQPGHAGYAHWGKRLAAYLIDGLIGTVILIPAYIGFGMAAANTRTDPQTGIEVQAGASGAAWALIIVGYLLFFAFWIWNYFIRQGKSGYTIGKGVLGIKLIKEDTRQPVGAGMAFVRYLAHILDALPCYIGFLWPLWDAKRQTFADKLCSTVVVDQPKG